MPSLWISLPSAGVEFSILSLVGLRTTRISAFGLHTFVLEIITLVLVVKKENKFIVRIIL